jgi:hypothetical protein
LKTPDLGFDTLEKLKKKAERLFVQYLAGASDLFPARLSIPRTAQNSDFSKLRDLVTRLEKDCSRHKAVIEYQTRSSRTMGKIDIPKSLVFPEATSLISFLDRQAETNAILNDRERILNRFPLLTNWCTRNPHHILAAHGNWPLILDILDWFQNNPQNNLYLREIPVCTDTKFIEQNVGLLRRILDIILPAASYDSNENTFIRRYGLKEEPQLLRFRRLDKKTHGEYSEVSVPVREFSSLPDISKLFIVENKMVYLTFPRVKNGLCVWGSGFGVLQLEKSQLTTGDHSQQLHLNYWGDLDLQGFTILSRLRQRLEMKPADFPSLLMDRTTWNQFSQFAVPGTPGSLPDGKWLSPEETALCGFLAEKNLRLEQERIPLQAIEAALKKLKS